MPRFKVEQAGPQGQVEISGTKAELEKLAELALAAIEHEHVSIEVPDLKVDIILMADSHGT